MHSLQIKADDEISKSICKQCCKLIDELGYFTERVSKVQTLYCLLQNLKPESNADASKLRNQFGVVDNWKHIIREESPRPCNVNREVQTDLVIFFNNNNDNCGSEAETKSATEDNPPTKENEGLKRQELVEILMGIDPNTEETLHDIVSDDNCKLVSLEDCTKSAKETVERNISEEDSRKPIEYEKEIVMEMTQEAERNFEFMIQNDDDLIEIDENEYRGKHNKHNVHTDDQGAEDEADNEDSDLFKELKFKMDETDEGDARTEENSQKDDNVEYQEVQHLEVDDCSDEMEYVEMENEEDIEEDYEETIETSKNDDESPVTKNPFDMMMKAGRKRGRPPLKGKSGQKSKSSSSEYRYECVECKRKYKSPSVYKKHMITTHDVIIEHIPELECPVCKKYCYNRSRLKSHMRQHLPDDEKLLFPCPYCEKRFAQSSAMRVHVNRIHHDLKPFICDQCGRACKTVAALNEHQLVHTDKCPYQCEVCNKSFKNKARLKSHMDTHNESEYTCPDCGLKLNTKRTLLQHRSVHSNVKRFKCEFCDAAFKRSKSLKNHLILHTGLRPYKCQFCEKTFSNGANCRSHKRRVHPKELAEEEAMGKKNEPVHIPKLEDLKAA